MKRTVLPTLLIAIATVSACETVVDVKLPPHEAQLVAQSLFVPDSLWRVNVSMTAPTTGFQEPGFVDDATVEIWDGNRRVEQLRPIGQGTYTSAANRPAPEKTYTLRVSAPGMGQSEGTGIVPPAARVSAFEQQNIEEDTGGHFGRRIMRVELTVDDPADVRNYYGLQIIQHRHVVNSATGETSSLPQTTFTFASNDPALGEADVFDPEKSRYDEAIFNDDLFDGRPHTLDFEFEYTVDLRDTDVKIERLFVVLFMTVSADYFNYWKTSELQNTVGDNPFAEPVRVYSNMTGGLGIFAGYHAQAFPLTRYDGE